MKLDTNRVSKGYARILHKVILIYFKWLTKIRAGEGPAAVKTIVTDENKNPLFGTGHPVRDSEVCSHEINLPTDWFIGLARIMMSRDQNRRESNFQLHVGIGRSG